MTANAAARRIKACRLLLSIGLLVTFATSIVLLLLHERMIEVVPDHPPFHATKDELANDGSPGREWPPVLSAYAEPTSSTDGWYDDPSVNHEKRRQRVPLPTRDARGRDLTRVAFPRVAYPSARATSDVCESVPSLLPVDDFGSTVRDPYLPWIHDAFVSHDGENVHIIGQNRRRCHKGKFHGEDMEYWMGQIALFQPVAVKRLNASDAAGGAATATANGDGGGGVRYRLSTHDEADADGIETRFICRFKSIDYARRSVEYEGETLSAYPFNYEFVNWRKGKSTMVERGKDGSYFWLSQLRFTCPIPERLRPLAADNSNNLLLDVVPIRTPTRRNDVDGYFFHDGHGGPTTFDAAKMWGANHVLPRLEDSGRWENLPVCSLKKPARNGGGDVQVSNDSNDARAKKPHRLVACTWTSALHQRRGNERRISDGKPRLKEWIAFNLQVGFDHGECVLVLVYLL